MAFYVILGCFCLNVCSSFEFEIMHLALVMRLKRGRINTLPKASGSAWGILIQQSEFKDVFHEFKMIIERINCTFILFRVLGNNEIRYANSI